VPRGLNLLVEVLDHGCYRGVDVSQKRDDLRRIAFWVEELAPEIARKRATCF
jgi:hypothetical protein